MYSKGGKANEDIVPLIFQDIKDQGLHYPANRTIKFIGFEASSGTKVEINGSVLSVPKVGYLITPFNGQEYEPIVSLKFPSGFNGNIYYIL